MTLGGIIPKAKKNYDDYHSCVDITADLLEPDRIRNKQWASFGNEVFWGECGTFIKFVVHDSKVNKKPYPEVYRLIRSKGAVMINTGRILEWEREYYRKRPWHSFIFDAEVTLIPEIAEERMYDLEEDREKEFIPSPALIDEVKQSLVPLDKETFAMLEDLKTIQDNKADENQVLSNIITEEIEDLFTNLARQMFISKKQIQILEHKSFTHDICMELIDRLGLHVKLSNPVLELLHYELIKFLSQIDPRERDWGKITIENSDIKFILNEDAFSR